MAYLIPNGTRLEVTVKNGKKESLKMDLFSLQLQQ